MLEGEFFFRYTSEAMGSSMVDVKVDEPNDGSTACLTDAGRKNLTWRRPGSNSSIGELLLLINQDGFCRWE